MKKLHITLILAFLVVLVSCQRKIEVDEPFDYSHSIVTILNNGSIYLDEIADSKVTLNVEVENALENNVVYILDQQAAFVSIDKNGIISIKGDVPDKYWFSITAVLEADKSKFHMKDFIVNHTRGVIEGKEQISQVVLTINGDPMTSRGISWFTSYDIEDSVVYLSEDSQFSNLLRFEGELNTFDTSVNAMDSANQVADSTHYNHQALLTGLKPNTKYYYKVGSDEIKQYSSVGSFTTAKGSGPVKIFLTTDVHVGANEKPAASNRYYHAALSDAFERYNGIDYAINTGDFVTQWYSGYHYFESEWASVMNISPLLRQLTFIPISGNHDGKITDPLFNYSFTNHFSLPKSPEIINDDHQYGPNYAFEINDTHITMLNYHEKDRFTDNQKLWLEDVLSKTNKKWKIVFSHIILPIDVQKILEKHNVVLAYSGHEHVYRRSAPLLVGIPQTQNYNNENGFVVNPKGTTYVVNTTTGGADAWRPYEPLTNEIDGFGLNSSIKDLGNAQTRWGMYTVLTIDESSIAVDIYVRNSTDAQQPFTKYTTYGFELNK